MREHELDQESDCLIRRVISKEGRSKAYVNGSAVTLQQLKALGQYLIGIHGQHAHQQLLKPEHQLQLLDEYANHPRLLKACSQSHLVLQQKRRQLAALRAQQQQRADRRQLLQYQVAELDEFALEEGEFVQLETEHKRLSHSQTLLEHAQLSFYQLYESDEHNALSVVQRASDNLGELEQHDKALAPIVSMLNDAAIQIEEAAQELRHYCEHLEIDPMRMQQVEQRYSMALELARKHQIRPDELFAFHCRLADEYASLCSDEETLESLEQECLQQYQNFIAQAQKLSQSRLKAASKLATGVEQQIRDMNMQHAQFSVAVEFDSEAPASPLGLDKISYLVATNPGQAVEPMEKVVSGGELSRIGLAIQVMTSSINSVPTMIFDEVDTGISGPTASVVGQLLRRLGDKVQVMCVTHLPQVAARAHNQLFVTKLTDANSTETRMLKLSGDDRVEELARLLAGDSLTQSAIANARELLKNQ